MGRQAASGLSLLLTAALLASPGCRRGPETTPDPASSFRPSGPGRESVLGIYDGTVRVGEMARGVRPGAWEGKLPAVQVSERVNLRLSFQGETFRVGSESTAWADGDLRLLGGTGSLDFGAGRWTSVVTLLDDGAYERVMSAGSGSERERLVLPAGAVVSELLPLYLGKGGPGPPGTRTVTVYSMTLGRELPVRVAAGPPSEGERMFTVSYWGTSERLWIDGDGLVTREEMALGVEARPPAEGEPTGALALEKVLSETAVPAVDVPSRLGSMAGAVLVLEGGVRAPPRGPWQDVRSEGDSVVVTLRKPAVPSPGVGSSEPLPPRGGDFGLDLDSERIRELASRITGGIEERWGRAEAVGRWVYANMGKSMRECFSALEALETGEGECQTHSLLTVSLARAAGIGARFAYGVVYMPDRSGFFYHTWVEVPVGGTWVPMDPTLGRFPAGVDHLTLAAGGYTDQFRLFPYVMARGGWTIRYAGPAPETGAVREGEGR